MTIPKDNTQLENARRLRREMTPHERKLWYLFLRKYPVKIYKQRIIGRFIVDFYCASARLVIELDGSQHYEPQGLAYDAERSQFLMSLGLEILRFSNRDIDRDFRGVCAQIDLIIRNSKKAARPSQSPAVTALPEGEPRGCICWNEKWSVSVLIRSISCFPPPSKERASCVSGNAPDFRFPRLTPPRIRGILSFREVTLL